MSAAKDKPGSAAMEFNRGTLKRLFMPREFPKAHRHWPDRDGQAPKVARVAVSLVWTERGRQHPCSVSAGRAAGSEHANGNEESMIAG